METRDRYVLLGSCFSQYMGEKILAGGGLVMANPLGTLYNPFSISMQVHEALWGREADIPVFPADNEWRCWWANTTFRSACEEETRKMVAGRLSALREELLRANTLVVTLGTNVCYKLVETGMVVANCQRQPDRIFREYRASVDEVTEALQQMVSEVTRANPSLKIVFTVSPYRYKKYGLHGSQLSKAVLLLAVDEVVRSNATVCRYFPAYEIMMDELRDYRYYMPDGVHPSPEAVDLIWKRFLDF